MGSFCVVRTTRSTSAGDGAKTRSGRHQWVIIIGAVVHNLWGVCLAIAQRSLFLPWQLSTLTYGRNFPEICPRKCTDDENCLKRQHP